MSFLIGNRFMVLSKCIDNCMDANPTAGGVHIQKMRIAISNGQQITCVLMCVLPREHINTRDTKSAFNLEGGRDRVNSTNNK